MKTNDKYDNWRKRIKNRLPELSQRVFALRTEVYNGCGFHYDLEMQLGYLIAGVNRYSAESFTFINQTILEVCGTSLFKQVIEIEREISQRKINH